MRKSKPMAYEVMRHRIKVVMYVVVSGRGQMSQPETGQLNRLSQRNVGRFGLITFNTDLSSRQMFFLMTSITQLDPPLGTKPQASSRAARNGTVYVRRFRINPVRETIHVPTQRRTM